LISKDKKGLFLCLFKEDFWQKTKGGFHMADQDREPLLSESSQENEMISRRDVHLRQGYGGQAGAQRTGITLSASAGE
jgi:hypothetical protein